MKITNEQIELLDSFTCERLSESIVSKQCASQIENDRGKQLIGYLLEYGNNEDSEGITAFYVIRNKDNLPLAFFSLKCGLLFAPSIIETVEKDAVFHQRVIESLDNGRDENNPDSVALFQAIEELAVKRNSSLEETIQYLKLQAIARKSQAMLYKSQYHDDEITEADKPIYRVHVTYPGIEIVHFCTNDNAKEYWVKQSINHPMGEVLFWWFIMPKLQNVQQIAGCQYAYLFAADSSEDRTLINYYNIALKFIKPEGIGTSKPRYDYCCEFLIQEINKLVAYRELYLQNFNLDDDDDVV